MVVNVTNGQAESNGNLLQFVIQYHVGWLPTDCDQILPLLYKKE